MTPEDCNICRQSGHAKWHELSQNGVIINPVVLIQLIEKLEQTAEVMRIKNYVCYLSQITPSQIDQSAQPVAPPAEVIRLLKEWECWERATAFTRACKNPVDAGDQMGLRVAAGLLTRFAAYLAQAPDGLVQEWVSKARAVAISKGFDVLPKAAR